MSKAGASGGGRFLQLILGLIFLLFIGILVALYFVAREANPVILDENGKPMSSRVMQEGDRKWQSWLPS